MFVHFMHLYIDIVSHSQYQYKVLVCTVFIPDISATDYDEFYLEKKKRTTQMGSSIFVKVTWKIRTLIHFWFRYNWQSQVVSIVPIFSGDMLLN